MYTRGTGFLLLFLVRSRGAIFVLETSLFFSLSLSSSLCYSSDVTSSSGSLYFIFIFFLFASQACPLGLDIYLRKKNICRVTFRVYRRQVRDAWCDVVAFGEERERRSHHRFCIQTYAKGREFCFDFRARFFFSLLSFFFFCFFSHITRLFGSIAFFLSRKSSFTAARNDSFPLEKARTNRLTILARIFSKFGSVVNVRFV